MRPGSISDAFASRKTGKQKTGKMKSLTEKPEKLFRFSHKTRKIVKLPDLLFNRQCLNAFVGDYNSFSQISRAAGAKFSEISRHWPWISYSEILQEDHITRFSIRLASPIRSLYSSLPSLAPPFVPLNTAMNTACIISPQTPAPALLH